MAVIDRRAVLDQLNTSELRSVASRFDIFAADGALRQEILEALARSSTTLGEMLMTLSRQRLKELCQRRGIEDAGREKIMIATRLLGVDPAAPPKPKAVPPIRRVRKET